MIVGDRATDRVSWSIRVGRDEHGRRAFGELTELVPELLAQCFPPSCGYEAHGTRLSGPIEGVRWTVTRGSFRGEVDVQRYDRAGVDRASSSAVALRLVASAGMREVSADTDALERRVVAWAVVGWGLGSVALGTLLLGLGGLVPVWGQVLVLVPAVAAWRASEVRLLRQATGSIAELPASSDGAARGLGACASCPVPIVSDGLRRWRELLPALQAQHDLLQTACSQAPFRNPGHLEATSTAPRDRVRQALAAGSSSFTWSQPALATEPSDPARASPSAPTAPPARTTHTRSR